MFLIYIEYFVFFLWQNWYKLREYPIENACLGRLFDCWYGNTWRPSAIVWWALQPPYLPFSIVCFVCLYEIFATKICQYLPLKFANIFHIDNYHYSIFFLLFYIYLYILLILIFWILLLFYSARIFSFLFLARNFFCTQKSRDFLCRDFLLLYSMTSFSSSLNVNTLYLSFT